MRLGYYNATDVLLLSTKATVTSVTLLFFANHYPLSYVLKYQMALLSLRIKVLFNNTIKTRNIRARVLVEDKIPIRGVLAFELCIRVFWNSSQIRIIGLELSFNNGARDNLNSNIIEARAWMFGLELKYSSTSGKTEYSVFG